MKEDMFLLYPVLIPAMSNMTGVLQEAETAYSSILPDSTPDFQWGFMLFICF